jgi:type IV pilus assembly protein PilN
MKITLNLASEPYVDLRSILKRLRIAMAVLVLLAIPLWLLLRAEQGKAAAATARVEAVENNVQRLQQQEENYQALMRQPKNAATLTQADFLNSLFQRKAFSWTATMTDLETMLPGGVQVLSLDPEVAPDGAVTIRLRVSGARDRALELVKNLERSQHFALPRLAGEALATSTGPNQGTQPINASIPVNFDILADYRPLTEAEEKADEAAAKKSTTKEKSGAKENGDEKTGDGTTPPKRPRTKAPLPNARPGIGPAASSPAVSPLKRGPQ